MTLTKAIRQCHEGHLRRDLLCQALEQARERGLLGRSAYAELVALSVRVSDQALCTPAVGCPLEP